MCGCMGIRWRLKPRTGAVPERFDSAPIHPIEPPDISTFFYQYCIGRGMIVRFIASLEGLPSADHSGA